MALPLGLPGYAVTLRLVVILVLKVSLDSDLYVFLLTFLSEHRSCEPCWLGPTAPAAAQHWWQRRGELIEARSLLLG